MRDCAIYFQDYKSRNREIAHSRNGWRRFGLAPQKQSVY
jgi:hypothetical protein